MTVATVRDYLKRNKPFLRISAIARQAQIDKNMILRFIDNKTQLKPHQRRKLFSLVRDLVTT